MTQLIENVIWLLIGLVLGAAWPTLIYLLSRRDHRFDRERWQRENRDLLNRVMAVRYEDFKAFEPEGDRPPLPADKQALIEAEAAQDEADEVIGTAQEGIPDAVLRLRAKKAELNKALGLTPEVEA